jgi:hypothetical protein
MKRKIYQRPTMNVVKLQQQAQLLDGCPSGQAGTGN